MILVAHPLRVAQVLDELKGTAERQDFSPLYIFNIIDEAAQVAVEREAIAESIFGDAFGALNRSAELGEPLVHGAPALSNLAMNGKAAPQVILLGDLEPHDQTVAIGRAI